MIDIVIRCLKKSKPDLPGSAILNRDSRLIDLNINSLTFIGILTQLYEVGLLEETAIGTQFSTIKTLGDICQLIKEPVDTNVDIMESTP